MRVILQRVARAEIRVSGRVVGRIDGGLLLLVGIAPDDTPDTGRALAERIVNLRVFEDQHGKMNLSLLEAGGSVLCISQFTLYGDCRKGRRPSFDGAASPDAARPLYESFVDALRQLLDPLGRRVETGLFQAMMEVESVNDGPVTLLLGSDKWS